MKTIVYPGTFDPITNGHIDLIERASRLFDKVIVGIAANKRKAPLFDVDERIQLASDALSHVPNIEVLGFDYLLVNFVKDCKPMRLCAACEQSPTLSMNFSWPYESRPVTRP